MSMPSRVRSVRAGEPTSCSRRRLRLLRRCQHCRPAMKGSPYRLVAPSPTTWDGSVIGRPEERARVLSDRLSGSWTTEPGKNSYAHRQEPVADLRFDPGHGFQPRGQDLGSQECRHGASGAFWIVEDHSAKLCKNSILTLYLRIKWLIFNRLDGLQTRIGKPSVEVI